MSHNPATGMPAQNSLAEQFQRYLQNLLSAQTAGLAASAAIGEVIPHEAGPAQPIDPRLAWDGAIAALSLSIPNRDFSSLERPADWSMLVCIQETAAGIAFAAGNFPQLLRNFQPLLRTLALASLRPVPGPAPAVPALVSWAEKVAGGGDLAQTLLAAGTLRLARHFQAASQLLAAAKASTPAEWQAALANEEAALAWHSGRAEEAAALWKAQADTVPVLFNRGMSSLFLGRSAESRAALAAAVKRLSEDSGWYHLGRLYLALAEAA